MRVLLIENSRLYLEFLSRLFDDLGFVATTASDVDGAETLLARGEIDLVCMNRYFRGADAIGFVRESRALLARIPVLLLTSDHGPTTRDEALAAGITEVIQKASVPEMEQQIRGFVVQYLRSDLRRGQVLYVEDSRTEAAVVTQLLRSMGLKVDHYHTAEDAIEQFDRHEGYDLVISDVLLKGEKSGLSLVGHIRGQPNDKARVPVLTVTGFDDVKRRIELLRAGTSDYIVKPVIQEELTVRVNNLISNKQLLDKVLAQQSQLHELAVTDQLTGCRNRRGFRADAEAWLTQRTSRDSAGVLMLDIDHFKRINDTWGHDTGDQVLAAVGGLLRRELNDGAIVSRFGGEEFAILLPGVNRNRAMTAARLIRGEIEALKPGGRTVTASIGVTALVVNDHDTLDRALSAADTALYRAKQRGRNRVSWRTTPDTSL